MTNKSIEIGGQIFDKNSTYFAFKWPLRKLENWEELKKLREFPKLHTASFSGFELPDLGLQYICENSQLQNLTLQDTLITNQGLQHLAQLRRLYHLRLKENRQLHQEAIPYLNQLHHLEELQIHETGIYEEGLQQLHLPSLRRVLVNEVDREVLLVLSRKMPQCSVLVKGTMEVLGGKILWER